MALGRLIEGFITILTPAIIIPKAKNSVTNPKIVLDDPVTFPACAATTWSATLGIKLTPINIVMKPSINLPSAIVLFYPPQH